VTTAPPRFSPSRRTWLSLLVPLVLGIAYWAVTAGVRAHVDGLVGAAIGRPLPAFRLVDMGGAEWSNEALRGRRVLLHFFRSFCGSCDAEAPGWRSLESKLPDDVVLLHVMTDAVLGFPPEATAATLQREAFARPVLMADAAFVDGFHQVSWSNVTPITYVVDAAGTIRFGLRGRQEPATVERAIAAVQ
jgi:peroxiredoxin